MLSLYYNKAVGLAAFGLPRQLWVVQAGVFLNYLGWGCVMPFEVIYLHDGRGFGLGVAGLVVGTVTGLAVVAVARTPWQAFLAAAAAGLGNGGLQPSQSALVASLAAPEIRHRASGVSRVASNFGVGLGGVAGGVVAAHGLNGFVVLFLVNALTYFLYALILVVGVHEDPQPAPLPGGYRVVLRDRAFVRLALINVAVIAVGWGVFSWIVPAYARGELGVGTGVIGFMVLANATTVVLVQLPVARLAEGHRRTATMAVAAVAFVGASLVVAGAGVVDAHVAAAALLASAVVVGAGECLHTTVLMPLVADL